MYVYIQSEKPNKDNDYKPLFTVGFYRPADAEGRQHFIPESDHDTKDKAAARVSYLNGGDHPRKPFPPESI